MKTSPAVVPQESVVFRSRICTVSLFPLVLLAGVAFAASNPHATGPTVTKQISYALLEDYDKGTDLKQVALDFQLMKTLGIDTWRGSFGWDDYEPQKGVYDFAWLHSFAQLADSYGIKLRPYIGYTAQWAVNGGTDKNYWNDPPKNVQDWYDFVYALTQAMSVHRNILSYEIYNEVNDSTWWDGSVRAYNEVLSEGAVAIRRGDPHAQVIMAGLVFPDYDWLSQICEDYGNSGTFDIAPFHAYPETWETSTVETYLDAQYYKFFVPELEQQCKRQPIWINELGFATTKGVTEQQQAYWWARAFATFLSDAHIQELGIYQIRDVPRGHDVIGGEANYHLGITKQDRTRKLAFFTVGMLAKLLKAGTITTADADVSMSVTSGQAVEPYYHLFKRPDGHQILFAYDKRGTPTVRLTLNTPGTKAISYSLDGKMQAFRNFDGNTLTGVQLAPGQIQVLEILP
jgi:polysaccharide biosynthesis protein PslG